MAWGYRLQSLKNHWSVWRVCVDALTTLIHVRDGWLNAAVMYFNVLKHPMHHVTSISGETSTEPLNATMKHWQLKRYSRCQATPTHSPHYFVHGRNWVSPHTLECIMLPAWLSWLLEPWVQPITYAHQDATISLVCACHRSIVTTPPSSPDTTFMYVLAGLGIYRLLKARNPDITPKMHQTMLSIAVLILLVVIGGVGCCDWFEATFLTLCIFTAICSWGGWLAYVCHLLFHLPLGLCDSDCGDLLSLDNK